MKDGGRFRLQAPEAVSHNRGHRISINLRPAGRSEGPAGAPDTREGFKGRNAGGEAANP